MSITPASQDEIREPGSDAGGQAAFSIPNLFTVVRLVAAPALILLALFGNDGAFLILYVCLLISDLIDGFLARTMNRVSELGARLDSIADLAMYACFAFGTWRLWPDIIRREILPVAAVVVGYVVPLLAGIAKYGRVPSYHTWGAKFSAVGMGISVILLFGRVARWPFLVCVPVFVMTALEEVAITAVLPEWRSNVPSLWHAIAERRRR